MSNENLGPIFVTGGAGFLGSTIVEALLSDRSFNPVISSVEPQLASNRQVPGAIYRDCDVSKADKLNALLDEIKPRVILHTIGPGFFSPPEAHYRVTYDLSKQLVAIAKKHPSVQALVYTCTAEVVDLHPSLNDHPLKEEEATLHSLHSGPNTYSRTKAATDVLALTNTTGNFSNQLLTAVLRTTGLYGPRDRLTIVELLKCVNTPKTQYQLGPNTLVHDWMYVDNCALAHVLAAKALLSPKAECADGEAFFISDGGPKKFWDFVRAIWTQAGDANWAPDGPHTVKQIPFWFIISAVGFLEWAYWILTLGIARPYWSTSTYHYMSHGCWFDISKARRVLGYEPLVDTDEGIRRTIAWFKENEGWEKKTK
ncbi:C-3 sterol dehydrogenase/C-4 decarboxylase-like protein [Lophiostoma macrostomum CBS 122681]|uniref:C-3 sterol dehydrogenase/C-4 decarboxylase-like protein n=1 Tax=Lophiostoma macrostomum CBS 122681 TaxID=1314788 RepID=A0A6A6TBI9_9PLEO|nr:C-3 sterol dehydrogenase/C-4 decarboxylase-like protein [Lophiostoma macrostomum CBS 122681]